MQCKPLSRYADADDGKIGDREQGGIDGYVDDGADGETPAAEAAQKVSSAEGGE